MKIKVLVVFILIMAFFVGCDDKTVDINSENAVERFNAALDKFFSSDSYTVTANTAMDISTEDKVGGLEMSAELKAKNGSEEGKKNAELKTVFNMNGETEELNGYFKDDFFYNQKKKIKAEYSTILMEANINIFKLTNEVLNPGTEPVVTKVDGGTKVDFDLNVAVLQKETPEFIPNLTSFLRVSEYDFIMSRCKISAVIGEDGILKACDFDIIAKDTLYDGTSEEDFKSFLVDCDIRINVSVSNINNTDFSFPDDLDTYAEFFQNTELSSDMAVSSDTVEIS